MASALNKRQQARNERTLQELIKTVPGNDKCADCSARNPGWASWSLGIFLCMRCAALHRKLGTHISKVKSLSMDKWDNDQVDNMRRTGNADSNRQWNPRNVKPNMPIDIDEVDGAMERFIRQKYEQKAFMADSRPGTRQNTGSTSSAEDRPPPLPPKPGKRFGFGLRAASSTFPITKTVTPPISPGFSDFGRKDTSPPRVNKASRVFGSNVSASGDGLESKLVTLRDMGFADEKRNMTVLKGLNGNLDRAVEALIRLGESGSGTTRGATPTPLAKPGANGISFDRTPTASAAAQSSNPFDRLDAETPVQQTQNIAPLQTQQIPASAYPSTTSPSNPYNPFMPPSQPAQYQQQNMEQSFQNMQISNQTQNQQPLFPNRTGGHSTQSQQFQQTNPFQQSFTPPPMPQIPHQYSAFFSQQSQPQQYQAQQAQNSSGNPFLKSTRSQIFTSSNPFDNHQSQRTDGASVQPNFQAQQGYHGFSGPGNQPSNPFQQSSQIPSMSQQPAHQNPYQQQAPQPMQQSYNPAYSQQFQPSNPYQQQPKQLDQSQQLRYAQQPFNKTSILALYNYPHLAPPRTETAPSIPADTTAPPAPGIKQRSVTMPVTSTTTQSSGPAPGAMNPFASMQMLGQDGSQPQLQAQGPGGPLMNNNGVRHVSNESVDFAGLMSGRHSPDAFAGLSSSFRR